LKLEQSAIADLILLFVIFDAVLILRSEDVYGFSAILHNSHEIQAWFLLCIVVNLPLWMLVLIRLEKGGGAAVKAASKSLLRKAVQIAVNLMVSMAVITYNTIPFTLRR